MNEDHFVIFVSFCCSPEDAQKRIPPQLKDSVAFCRKKEGEFWGGVRNLY
jgi:hypothetical protein